MQLRICLRPGVRHASGAKSLITGDALAAVADANGIARVECSLHPWMRTDVRIK